MDGIVEFFASLPPWVGTVPQMISAGGILGILTLMSRTYLLNRRIDVDASKVKADIEAELREHFSNELDRLQDSVSKSEERQQRAEDRQQACEQREEKLRLRVRKLEDQLTGIVRSLGVEGSLRVLDLSEHPSDDILKAAISSLENILARRDNPEAKA